MQLARRDAEPQELLVGVVDAPQLPADPGLEAQFCDVYRRIHDRARDHAEQFLSRDDACDAVADAVADIWTKWTRLMPEQRVDAYFFGAIHHKILKRLERDVGRVSLEAAEAELARLAIHEIDTPTRTESAADVLDLVVNAMPPKRRAVFVLIREHGFTYKEVATILGVTVATLNTHMRLAGEDLRAAFTRQGFRIESGSQPRLEPGKEGVDE